MTYTNEEYACMHFMYGLADGNASRARRLYQERYPTRRLPDRKTFEGVHRRLCEYGSFARSPRTGGRPKVARPEEEEAVLNIVEENPGISTRRLGLQTNLSHMSVWRLLREQQLYPYHLQRVQALSPADYPARLMYCQWFLQQCGVNPNFGAVVLFTDEATFTRDGIQNFHNQHVWADTNPNATVETHHQQRFSINIWAGIVGDSLLGPYVLPNRLNGRDYTRFLRNQLPCYLEDMPLASRQLMFFMHDGAPAHFSLSARRYLNQKFGLRWIGRGGPIAWPPRSPDLNPLDFYLWGHLKSLVYSTPVDDVRTLHARIVAACQTVRTTPGIFFYRVRDSMRRRAVACIESQGGHFEHFI